jgi:beta-lactamase regulating signal transducer with metallopeptidase domain
MMSAWMVYATVLSAFAYAATLAAEHVMWIWRSPRRVPWLIAVGISVLGPLVLPMTRGAQERATSATQSTATIDARLTAAVDRRESKSEPVPTTPVAGSTVSVPGGVAKSHESLLIRGWIVSSSVAVLFLLIACARLQRKRSGWRKVEIDGIPVLVAPEQGPAVIGVWHPRIVIPEWSLALDTRSRSVMLQHEREHLAARDPQCLFLGAVAVALMPWNVPLWLMLRGLRRAIELDCDQRVLLAGSEVQRYGALLLDFAAHHARPLGLAAGLVENRSLLERRIRVMTAIRPRRPLLVSLPLVLSIAVATLGATRTSVPHSPLPDMRARESSSAKLVGTTTSAPIIDGALVPAHVSAGRSGVRSARVRSEPRINADWENAPVQEVIAAFASFSHRRITVSADVQGLISTHVVDQPWTAALKSIMSAHGFDVTFNADSTIAIGLAKPLRGSTPSERVEQPTSSREITGTVTDAETGQGISGARINVAGTQAIGEPNEAWTNDRGQFSLRGPDGEVWLDACAAGYEFTRVTVDRPASVANFHGRRTATFVQDTALYGSVVETPRVAVAGIPVLQPVYVVDGTPVGASASRRPACGLRRISPVGDPPAFFWWRGVRLGSSAPDSSARIAALKIAHSMPNLCIVNGKEAKCDDVVRMLKNDHNHIENAETLEGAAAARLYGDRAYSGVLVVTSRP